MKWRKAKPDQILGDGDQLLVTGINPHTKDRWYETVTVYADEDVFALRYDSGDDTEILWGDLDYWCFEKDIPAPEAAEAAGGEK